VPGPGLECAVVRLRRSLWHEYTIDHMDRAVQASHVRHQHVGVVDLHAARDKHLEGLLGLGLGLGLGSGSGSGLGLGLGSESGSGSRLGLGLGLG
jgi:hypothetical protein